MTAGRRGAFRGDRGSVLILMPVGVLILMVLAAITIDLSNIHLQQRQLFDAASAASNDAVTYGVDQNHLREQGEVVLDDRRVTAAIDSALVGRGFGDVQATATIGVGPSGNPEVTVTVSRTVDYIFGRTVGYSSTNVTAQASAEATQQ